MHGTHDTFPMSDSDEGETDTLDNQTEGLRSRLLQACERYQKLSQSCQNQDSRSCMEIQRMVENHKEMISTCQGTDLLQRTVQGGDQYLKAAKFFQLQSSRALAAARAMKGVHEAVFALGQISDVLEDLYLVSRLAPLEYKRFFDTAKVTFRTVLKQFRPYWNEEPFKTEGKKVWFETARKLSNALMDDM
jgi:hypothetical protein